MVLSAGLATRGVSCPPHLVCFYLCFQILERSTENMFSVALFTKWSVTYIVSADFEW